LGSDLEVRMGLAAQKCIFNGV